MILLRKHIRSISSCDNVRKLVSKPGPWKSLDGICSLHATLIMMNHHPWPAALVLTVYSSTAAIPEAPEWQDRQHSHAIPGLYKDPNRKRKLSEHQAIVCWLLPKLLCCIALLPCLILPCHLASWFGSLASDPLKESRPLLGNSSNTDCLPGYQTTHTILAHGSGLPYVCFSQWELDTSVPLFSVHCTSPFLRALSVCRDRRDTYTHYEFPFGYVCTVLSDVIPSSPIHTCFSFDRGW